MALALPLRWVLCGEGLTCQYQVGLPDLPCRSPGQGWMGPAQPSKLLFLFMILFPLEENCWGLLFQPHRVVLYGAHYM